MTQQEFFTRYTYNTRTDKLGGGAFGTVYKAYDNVLDKYVAIKISEVKTIGGKEFSLMDEFNAIKGLSDHTNIAKYEQLFSFDQPNGVFDFAIIQYYPDGNLKDLIKNEKLTQTEKEKIAKQILEGLSFLHHHKVVHRDMKPSNILIHKREGKNYIPKIADFGLSKKADPNAKSRFTNSFGGGTLEYSSPEQLRGQNLRFNTDLWAWAVIVYELFTEKPLFQPKNNNTASAENEKEIFEQILNKDISSSLKDIPTNWSNALLASLDRNPETRVKTANEIFDILKNSKTISDIESKEDDTKVFEKETEEKLKQKENETKVLDKKEETKPILEDKTQILGGKVSQQSELQSSGQAASRQSSQRPTPKADSRPIIYIVIATMGLVLGFVIWNSNKAEEAVEAPGVSTTIDKINIEMIAVEGGTFTMGCTSEQSSNCFDGDSPTHQVTVSSFNIGKYEVTQAQWRAVMGNNPSHYCDNCPVEIVSWDDIKEFLKKLNEKTGKTYRLPTEAEWEFAARGGNKSQGFKYAGSNDIETVAWYDSNSTNTKPVGKKSPNELGLFDMSGNVWEWCSDWYGVYSSSAQTNPQGPTSGSHRVLRGGCWGSLAVHCRVAYRDYFHPDSRSNYGGFRVAF